MNNMKILYSVLTKDALNPFLKTLTDAIKKEEENITLDFNPSYIWDERIYDFDILHIMWPEFLVSPKNTAADLKQRLIEIKNNGVRIVSTCHNIEPHYCKDINKRDAIDICYGLSDTIHHLGQYSLNLLSKLYPDARHEHIPHHIYDNIYKDFLSKEEACEYLGLSCHNSYILSIGAIRDIEEINLLKYVAKHLKNRVKLIAPSLILNIGKRSDFKIRIKYYKDKYLTYHNRLISNIGIISDEELPYYLAASDISLIQRIRILNSGNVTLGMQAGNVIIGPEVGNVGVILKETGNLTFNKQEDIPNLIDIALKASMQDKGMNNRQYALSNWSSSIIAGKVLSSYRNLLSNSYLHD